MSDPTGLSGMAPIYGVYQGGVEPLAVGFVFAWEGQRWRVIRPVKRKKIDARTYTVGGVWAEPLTKAGRFDVSAGPMLFFAAPGETKPKAESKPGQPDEMQAPTDERTID